MNKACPRAGVKLQGRAIDQRVVVAPLAQAWEDAPFCWLLLAIGFVLCLLFR
jgi:hypothetical protein